MFDLADIWATRTGHDVRLVSANDHVHSRGSAHYAGLALDFQSSDPEKLSTVFRFAGYRVLWKVPGHYGHVHVEEQGGSSDTSMNQRPLSQMPRRAPTPWARAGARAGG
jgi:predicted TIM-barrel fold metal-dependent hydrolase